MRTLSKDVRRHRRRSVAALLAVLALLCFGTVAGQAGGPGAEPNSTWAE